MSQRTEVGLLLHFREEHRDGLVEKVRAEAAERGYEVWTSVADPAEAMANHADRTALLVSIGGDGTFLLAARLAAPAGIPVLGANRGQLGFLTDVEVGELPGAVAAFLEGRYRIQRRSLVTVVMPDGDHRGLAALALNEVVVKSTGVNLARIRVEVDDELLGEFDADGVIVATATGSTAYALSAGGPPVDPRVRALVVVPLAPHAVITRAVVVPEAVTVVVAVLWGRAFVAADGYIDAPMPQGARLAITPGPELQVVQVSDSPPFLRRLREKVRFGTPLKDAADHDDRGHDHPPRAAWEPAPTSRSTEPG